jgi:hypothetical protein
MAGDRRARPRPRHPERKAVVYDAALGSCAASGARRSSTTVAPGGPAGPSKLPGDWERGDRAAPVAGRAGRRRVCARRRSRRWRSPASSTAWSRSTPAAPPCGPALALARSPGGACRPSRRRLIGRSAGQVADASHLAAKARYWARARRAPRAARFHVPVSYLVEQPDRRAGRSTRAHASTTMLYDLAAAAWSRRRCCRGLRDRAGAAARDRAGTATAGGRSPIAGAARTGLADRHPGRGRHRRRLRDRRSASAWSRRAPCSCARSAPPRSSARSRRPRCSRSHARLVETHPLPRKGGYARRAPRLARRRRDDLARRCSPATIPRPSTRSPRRRPGADGVTFVPALTGAMVAARGTPAARGAFVRPRPRPRRRPPGARGATRPAPPPWTPSGATSAIAA